MLCERPVRERGGVGEEECMITGRVGAMQPQMVIIDCPDCEGGGKVLQRWFGEGLFTSDTWVEKTNKDCKRCNGLGKLRVKASDIKTE